MITKDKKSYREIMSALDIVKSVPNITVPQHINSLITGDPFYTSLDNQSQLEKEYEVNPVLSSVINLKADYISNAAVSVRNVKNGEIITDKQFKQSKTLDPIIKSMFRLKNNPNPLQSTKEFFGLTSIFKDVFGNSFIYGNSVSGSVNIKDVAFLWAVWPQYMKPELNGNIFDAASLSGIIKGWDWKKDTYSKRFSIEEILHRKDPNIGFNNVNDLVLGTSRQKSLSWPLSNIRIAYESRNVIARERGMRAIISSSDSDGNMGSIPMGDTEKQEVQRDLRNYGFRNGQDQFMVTRHNIAVHHVDQDVRKLGLLNEIASDAMAVSERYGVPEILVKLYIKGATFENQESSERRMYQNTTIPEMNDFIEDLNVWLKTRDFGYEYIVDFNHIPVLQKNEKDRSEINKNINTINKELFFSGAIIYNQWLQAIGYASVDQSWAKKRITEMTDEEIFRIKGNYTLNSTIEEDGNQ
jgi:hypothetical protein